MDLKIAGLPEDAKKASLEEFRIDRENSNAYTAWQKMGRPEKPTTKQYAALQAAGQLKMTGSPEPVNLENGNYARRLELARQGLVLLRLKW